jgi:hypothetical protein
MVAAMMVLMARYAAPPPKMTTLPAVLVRRATNWATVTTTAFPPGIDRRRRDGTPPSILVGVVSCPLTCGGPGPTFRSPIGCGHEIPDVASPRRQVCADAVTGGRGAVSDDGPPRDRAPRVHVSEISSEGISLHQDRLATPPKVC